MAESKDCKQDSTTRFSHRVESYVGNRPNQPREVLDIVQRKVGRNPSRMIAELTGGTGNDKAPLWFLSDNEYVALHGVGGSVAAMYISNVVAVPVPSSALLVAWCVLFKANRRLKHRRRASSVAAFSLSIVDR